MHEGRAGGDGHRGCARARPPHGPAAAGGRRGRGHSGRGPRWRARTTPRRPLPPPCRRLRALIFCELAFQREGSSFPLPPASRGGRRRRARRSKEFEVQTDVVRDWSELPLDVLSSVFAKVGAVDVLMGAGLVCQSWVEAAKVPNVWQKCQSWVEAAKLEHHEVLRGKKRKNQDVLCAMAKAAVDRSNGRLEVFAGREFVTDELLNYIAERSPSLKSLSLDYCNVSNEAFTELIINSPLLEELLISLCPFVGGDIYEAIGRVCTQLKRFMLRHGPYGDRDGVTGIEMMHELRYLTLVGSDITTEELVDVINSCPHMERLCVRNCRNIVVDGALRAKCSKIKTLTLPPLQNMLYSFLVHPDDGLFTDKFDDWRSS